MCRSVLHHALIVSAVAYRDAIDRILSIPLSEMIGLPLQGKSSHSDSEDGGPGIDPEEHLLLPIDADSESDVQVTSERTVSIQLYTDHILVSRNVQ